MNKNAIVDYSVRRTRRQERRQKLIQLLGGRCVACGATKDLEFDHKNKKTKTIDIANSIDTSEDVLLNEIKKCQLLCRRCHIKKTKEHGDFALPASQHGTLHHYRNHGCRCEKCKSAASRYYFSKKKMAEVVEHYCRIIK